MKRFVTIALLLSAAGCHRSTVADEGAQARAYAFPMAISRSSTKAQQVSPDEVPAAAKGMPYRQPPVPTTGAQP